MRKCDRCGSRLDVLARSDARFCSTRCRVAAHRAGSLPVELTSRRSWVRADGKRPIAVEGAPASSTDPSSWSSFAEVRASSVGDGFGVMLGDGLGCWDLDHCLDGGKLAPWAREVLDSIGSPVWVERSVSGTGLHVFVLADEARGFRRGGVEFYSRHRFIRVTGDRFAI